MLLKRLYIDLGALDHRWLDCLPSSLKRVPTNLNLALDHAYHQ